MSLKIIRAIRNYPGTLINSLDMSTAEKCLFGDNPGIPDKTLKQKPTSSDEDFEIPGGDESSTIRGFYSLAILMMVNYMLSPYPDDEILDQEYEQQKRLVKNKVQEARLLEQRGELPEKSPTMDDEDISSTTSPEENLNTESTKPTSNSELSSFL
jgi:hypothetical protein